MVNNVLVNELFIVLFCCACGNSFKPKKHGIVTPGGGTVGTGGSGGIGGDLQQWPVPFFSDNNFGLITTAFPPPPPLPVTQPAPVNPIPIPTIQPSTIGTTNTFITSSSSPGAVTNTKSNVASTIIPPSIIDASLMVNYSGISAPNYPSSPVSSDPPVPPVIIVDPAYMVSYPSNNPVPISAPPNIPNVPSQPPKSTIDPAFMVVYTTTAATLPPASPTTVSTTTSAPSTTPATTTTTISSTSTAAPTTSTAAPSSSTATITTTTAPTTTVSSTITSVVTTASSTQTPFTSVLLNTSRPLPSPTPTPFQASNAITLSPVSVQLCDPSSTYRPLGVECNYKPPALTNQVTLINPSAIASNFQLEIPVKFDVNITSLPNYIVSVSPITQTESDVVEIVSATANRLVAPSGITSSLNNIKIDPHLNTGWNTTGFPTAPPPVPSRISQDKCLEYYSTGRRNTRKAQVTVFIIGGQSSKQKEFPHMAALGYGAKSDNQWLCGGSLISENYVITAAHCLTSKPLGLVQHIRLGTTTLQTETLDSADYTVIRRIPYPSYVEGRQYDDLALLQLDRPVQFTEYIAPICLYTSINLAGQKLTATGWGKTSTTSNTALDLQKVDLDYVPNDVCRRAYSIIPKEELPYSIMDATQLCAGSADGSKDTCQGDSGGPLQIQQDGRLYLVGVTSFGIGCGQPGIPGVYTRIASYISWIEQTVWGR